MPRTSSSAACRIKGCHSRFTHDPFRLLKICRIHEIAKVGRKCKFVDCTHLREAFCAVQKVVAEGKIFRLRFDSCRGLMKTIFERVDS